MDLESYNQRLEQFATDRDWGQFHNPKNLAVALSVEASELLEIFQWLTPQEAEQIMAGPRSKDVRDELADVQIYLLRLASVLNVDLEVEVDTKIRRNEERFPASGRPDTNL